MSTTAISNANTTTPQLANAGPTDVCSGFLTNLGGTIAYLKLWDAAKASDVTVGTTPPTVVIPVPPGATAPHVANPDDVGLFKLGLVWAVTTGLADNDNTAAAAGVIRGTLNWEKVGFAK